MRPLLSLSLRARRTAGTFALALIALAAGPGPGGAAVYYVGPGGDCEAASVEAAVALAAATSAADEIRIVETQTFNLSASLHLTDWGPADNGALILSGGWSSCSDASPSVNRSTLSWPGAGPVMEIDTTGANTSLVTLQTLTLRDAQGRGLVIEGNSIVDILGTSLSSNDGGGMLAGGGSEVYLDSVSSILDNGPAPEGGAIRCVDSGTSVTTGATLRWNESANNG